MKAMGRLLMPLMSLIVLAACSKSNDDDHEINNDDIVVPVIEIYTPTDNQVFSNGNTISVAGKVTDDKGLYRGTIKITDDTNGAVVKEQAYEIHGFLSYSFNLPHVTSVSIVTNYTVAVQFEDHGTNVSAKSVKVRVNP